eukprot:290418-Amorphochlora_amoeboformis.AAC.1
MSLNTKDLLALAPKINLNKTDCKDNSLRVKTPSPPLEPDSEPEILFKTMIKFHKKIKKKPEAKADNKHQVDVASDQPFKTP